MTFGKTTMLKLEFAAREFAREGASACQHMTIVDRGITSSGVSMGCQKGREILFGDAHKLAEAVRAQRTGLDPAARGSGRHRAALGDLFQRQQRTGRTRCGR